jgi:hypothetical protein
MRLGVRIGLAFALASFATLTGFAAPASPEQEAFALPTAARLDAIHSAAQREGWKSQTSLLRGLAQRAYEHDQLAAAAAWLRVYRWSALFGQTEDEFLPRWIQAVQSAGVGHTNMQANYRSRPITLAAYASPECQLWLISHAAFTDEFFGVLRPVDYVPEVFKALSELHSRDLRLFETYSSLALAIAVVHDVPPPPDWPHAQVSPEALTRRWPSAVQAFLWWTNEDTQGRTYHKLSKLEADELKFVVDSAAPFDELEWSQQVANYPIDQLDRAYKMIAYRTDRAANIRPIWTEKDYALSTILGAGGICVDQAYFAAHVGKARGVPTLIFQGAGSNGRHAWFGFLDSKQKWRLDAGRYPEQSYVTGIARDPQTWGAISDHELQFLAERFRTQPSFRESQLHLAFATDYLAAGAAEPAERAAKKAVTKEPRNQIAWEVLLAAGAALHRDARQQERTMTEAIGALQRYPDLELHYSHRLCESLRQHGNGAAADAEERRVTKKYQSGRNDLSIRQARETLVRSFATTPVAEQIRIYNSTLDNFGRGAGIAFFDQIVVTFVEHLTTLQKYAEARKAAEQARATLKVETNSQLEQEFSALLKRVRARG